MVDAGCHLFLTWQQEGGVAVEDSLGEDIVLFGGMVGCVKVPLEKVNVLPRPDASVCIVVVSKGKGGCC